MKNHPDGDRELVIDEDHAEEAASNTPARRRSLRKWVLWTTSICVCLIGGWYFVLEPTRTRQAALRSECQYNLHQIGIALHNYHDQYGTFPPAYVADENGKPMHSWRVLILPMLEQEELYKQYRFDEPWDGPNNRMLHDKMPKVFQCPSDEHEHDNRFSNYVAVVGTETAWPSSEALNLSDIEDDSSNTILVVEMSKSYIHWMEPRDLNFDKMSFKVNDPAKPSISTYRLQCDGEPHVLSVDGGVRSIPQGISEESLKALLTISGGEEHIWLD